MDPMTTVDGDMKMCRICLESEYELRSIYKMGKILDQCVKLCDVLSECTSLVVRDYANIVAPICIRISARQ